MQAWAGIALMVQPPPAPAFLSEDSVADSAAFGCVYFRGATVARSVSAPHRVVTVAMNIMAEVGQWAPLLLLTVTFL